MLATTQDLMVLTVEDFERLPEDGMFEVVNGRAILLPGNDVLHQKICRALFLAFWRQLESLRLGFVLSSVNVFIPIEPGSFFEVKNRVPDLVVCKKEPAVRFEPGNPPEMVIEVLSTRRGNVERTEKLDDYAYAGIGEYWIVNFFDRVFEVYRLEAGEYRLLPRAPGEPLRTVAFPGIEIDPTEIWAALG